MGKKKRKPQKVRRRRHRRIKVLTNEITQCLNEELWYAALVLTLTLPDICAALESPTGFAETEDYKAWYEQWLIGKYPKVRSKDLYYLRCGMAHQGKSQHPKIPYNRIYFTLGSGGTHMKEHKGALILNINEFAKDMIDAVEEWYAKQEQNQNVHRNISALIQHYPSLDFLDEPAIG
jgi:hypothetical protein